MNATVEIARAFDGPAISAILSDWIDETPWMPRIHTPEENRGFGRMVIDKTDVSVARVDGQVVGFIAQRLGFIHSLYMTRLARGQGIGKQLLDCAKSQQDALELRSFQANMNARKFYARHGFVEVEQTDGRANDEKLPDVRLIWARSQA